MAVYEDLGTLTYLVEATVDLRDQALASGEGLSERDRVKRRLEELYDSLEDFRSTLVSTDEAGWLSGQELLREELGNLFGGVNGYGGKPSDSQLSRQIFLHAKLLDARDEFERLAGTDALADLNSQLERKELEPLAVMTVEAWETGEAASGAAAPAPSTKSVKRLSKTVPSVFPALR